MQVQGVNNQISLQHMQQVQTLGSMQIVCASGEIFNHVDQGLPMWSGQGDRKVVIEVSFKIPFAAPPIITMGLTGVDSAHDQNLRLWVLAQDITETGFKIEFSTWDDTHIARAAVSWHAIGAAKTSSTVSPQPG